MERTSKSHGLQCSARPLRRSPEPDQHPQSEGLLRISRCTGSPLRNGLDFSVCAYKYRSLSKDELVGHRFQEVGRTFCDIHGMCETLKGGTQSTWRDGNTLYPSAGHGERRVSRSKFVVCRKWSTWVVSRQFRQPWIDLRLDSKKKPSKSSKFTPPP